MNTLLLESLKEVMVRDLAKLEGELVKYPDEASLWTVEKSILNPAGNLALHLCGNLQFYIGNVLGKTGYVRNRDLEFSAKNIPRAAILSEIGKAKEAIEKVLPMLTEAQLTSDYPVDVFGKPMKTLFFLIHLSAHLSYHLGQVNYHRRLVPST